MGDTPSKEEKSTPVKISLKRETTNTDYHKDGTRTEHKTVEYFNLSAPDSESFRSNLAGVKAIGFY